MAESTRTSKSRIIRDALSRYLDDFDGARTPFEAGRDLFGVVGSGRGNLSASYKRILRQRLREKHPR